MLRVLLVLAAALLPHSVYAGSIAPQVPAAERAVYMEMLKTNPTAAKKYLITREYVSQCRQVVDNPKRAIDLPNGPDGFEPRYVSKDEMEKLVKKAMLLAFAAETEKKH